MLKNTDERNYYERRFKIKQGVAVYSQHQSLDITTIVYGLIQIREHGVGFVYPQTKRLTSMYLSAQKVPFLRPRQILKRRKH